MYGSATKQKQQKEEIMDEKKQIGIMTSVALVVLAGIILFVSYSSPNVYENKEKDASQQTLKSDEHSTLNIEYPLDLNTATMDELMSVNGIGESRARAIIKYREQIGSYTSVEQLMDIDGFGESLYLQVAAYFTV